MSKNYCVENEEGNKMWVSLKRMEEEDLIFMNSTHHFSYFWSSKRFPGHQQELPNTWGALCNLMACGEGHLLRSSGSPRAPLVPAPVESG